jgi:hypothetical protein
MKKWARIVQILVAVTAAMGLANCGKYNCNTDDGMSFSGGCSSGSPSSISSSSGGSGSSGSGSGSATAAFVFAIDAGVSNSSSPTNGSIAGFTLNMSANTLSPTSGYTAPSIPPNEGGVGMVVAQKQFLYAGFGTLQQLYAWTISSTTGALTAISGSPYTSPFLASVGSTAQAEMITNPAGSLLFISATSQDEIRVFQIGTTGALTEVSGSPFSVPFAPANLSTDGLGKYLYAVHADFSTHTGTEIAAYSIGSSGSLTAISGSPFAFPMWQVEGEPTGKFLIGTTGNSEAEGYSGVEDLHLYVFSISSTGAISPVSGSPFDTVYSPFSIAVSPNSGGNLVYSFGFNADATAFNPPEGYEISSTGTLTAVAGSPFTGLPSGSAGSWGQFDQSGAFLINYANYVDPSTATSITQLSPFNVATGGALTQTVDTLTLANPGFWVVTDPQ